MDLLIKSTAQEAGLLRPARKIVLSMPKQPSTHGLLGTTILFLQAMFGKILLPKENSSYQEFLAKARLDGWRGPLQVAEQEIAAYKSGMIAERNRVLSIFKDVENGPPMRFMEIWQLINMIRNNPV